MKSPKGLYIFALVVAAAILSACSGKVSVGEKTVDAAELQDTVATKLQEQVGAEEAPDITCDEDLKAEEGATTVCIYTDSETGEEYDVDVEVTSVEDGQANFDVQVAEEPNS